MSNKSDKKAIAKLANPPGKVLAIFEASITEIQDAVLTEMNRRNVDTETYLKAEMVFASVKTMLKTFIN